MESFVEFDIPAYSREAILVDLESPQNKAIAFLSHDPQTSNYTAERRLARYSLAVLYFSLNSEIQGNQWNYSTGWATNTSECDWYTTFRNESICDSSGAFTTLELEQNQLFGSLPTEIELLSDLQRVQLTKNTLRGSIPSEIGGLHFLSYLDLSENELGGTIPSTLSNLSVLRYLDLWNNFLVGVIPESLFGGSGGSDDIVEEASLRGSNRRSQQRDSHERISLLENLCLESNALQGTIPTTVGNARNLRQFCFRDNAIEGTLPESMSNLTLLDYFGTFPLDAIPVSACVISPLSLPQHCPRDDRWRFIKMFAVIFSRAALTQSWPFCHRQPGCLTLAKTFSPAHCRMK
jgi:Leucine Rich Repeat